MSTYCRITGKSRGLPKPNYFPLLPPISPADAKRLCRITGKSYGLPSHHFIPVLVGFTKHSKTSCHITANADHAEVAHVVAFGIKHTVLKNYRYVFPVLETNADLVQMLESKTSKTNNNKYVYMVDERRCSLVFPSKLEAAVRDGDVRDIMLAAHTDTLLLKLRKGGSVEVDVRDMSVDDCMDLYEGEGPSQEVLQKRRKRANKARGDTNDWRRKIFEDKERQADYEEERMSEIKSKRIKVKLEAIKETPHVCSWNNVREGLIELHADPELDQTVSKTILQFGQQDLQNFINITGAPIINTLPQCLKVQTENVDLSVSIPGIIKQPIIHGEQVTGFPIGAVIAPFQPLIAVTDEFIDNEIQKFNMSKDILEQILIKQLDLQAQYGNMLPPVHYIHNLAKQLETSINTDNEIKTEFGVKLVLENGPMYVPGHFFNSPSGETFVPGNIIETSMGPCFIAGFSVNTPDGVKFLPGRIVKDDQQPVFVAGQMAVTREGEKFVQGQMVGTKEGPKFIPGQTVITSEGVKFIPGQVIQNADDQSSKFIPGQTIMTPEGPQFVTGQFTQSGEEIVFVPGQAVLNENYNWEFIPGKNMKTDDGTYMFVPGKEIVNEQGTSQFVPGRMIIENSSIERFLPGLTVDDGNGNMRFVPGMQLETPKGIKFVEGMMIKTDDSIAFAVGKVSSSGVDGTTIEFSSAKTADDIVMHDMISNFGMCFSSALAEEGANETEVFGHMIQSAQGVEFFPGDATGLPAGKQIPGKLIKGKEIRFIPGAMIDNKFIPGQFVTTENEEKFIPGQVIETNEGPKFVPGQVLQTKSGPKFVPGQTMETEDGPKFIPGQIIETKSGPTFIPGQVIYTEEEGSRFVPGQVVDTIEGPRFVPGRVVETGDHVTFVPGQIVETEDGLKFIAPDLEDDLEGGYQFTVQGFEVAQEELKMIQRNSIPNACFFGEMAIDSQTLQHLAQAGMVVGRQLPVDVPAVNIKSFPATEAACKIANKLDVDTLYSAKLSHILSTLQQARQSGVPLNSEEVGNEDMVRLLNLALECNSNANLFDILSDAIEDLIQQDMAKKLNTIDTLHVVSVELAAKVRDQKPDKALLLQTIIKGYVEERSEVVDKLMTILNGHKTTMSTALQHMSQHNPKFIDEVLKNVEIMLESSTDENNEKVATEILAQAIVKTMGETSQSKVQQALNTDKNNSLQLLVESCKIANNLDVGLIHSVKLHQIMATLQQAYQSSVALTSGEVGNANMVRLLNEAMECDSNANLMKMLSGTLKDMIKNDKAGTLSAIDTLHKVSVKLATKVKNKKPNKVLLLKNIIRGNIEKNNVMKLLQIVLNNSEPTICNSFQQICQQNPEIVEQVLEKVTNMLKGAVDTDAENKATEILCKAIVEIVTESNDLKILKSLSAQQAQHSDEARDLKMFIKSCELVNDLGVDALQSVKLNNILTTLERVRQSCVVVSSNEVLDKNLLQLLNIALESDSNNDLLDTLGDALKHVINQNEAKISDTIDALNKASFKLAAKVYNKKPNKALLLKNVIEGNVEEKRDIVEKLSIILNDYESTICNAFQDMCQQNPDFVDKIIKKATGMFQDIPDMNDENKAMEILYQAIAETITNTKDSKTQKFIRNAQIAHGNKSSDLSLLIKSCELANNLGVDALLSVKLDHILSTLQQVQQSNVAISSSEVADENLMHLLNIVSECDSNENLLNTLAEALEGVIKGNKDSNLNVIDTLHSASIKLAAKVHNKKPNKVVLLRNIIKGNVGEKSEVVDKFITILNDYDSEVSAAFHQMINQTPEFVDKVLENIIVLLKNDAEIKNEKEASEIVFGAFIKAICETSDSKIEQALYSNKSNSLHLLIKSGKVANTLNVDTPHLVKLYCILSSLEQICQSNVVLLKEEVGDEKLMKLLILALESDSHINLVDTLASAVEDTINQDMANKLNTIDALHIVSVGLAAKVKVRKPDKALLLHAIVKGNVRNKSEVIEQLMTILNGQDSTISTALQHMSQQNPEFVDEVLKNTSIMLQSSSDMNDEEDASEILVQAVVKTMTKTSPFKIRQALNNDENSSLHLLVESCKVANNMNLDVIHSVKLNNILSTLQQVCKSNVALNSREVGDENMMQLLNIAFECNSNADLSTLANTLEDMIKHDKAGTLNAIDSLYKVSVKLAAKVQNKKPNKALLLKNVIKSNAEENADVVGKLMIVLNDYEPSVCNAFQHLSQQNPKFVEQVIEKVTKLFDAVLDSNNENKAMEILYEAIVETISETSDSQIQQYFLHEQSQCDNKLNNLSLLVKSCKLVSNLGVDSLQSVKLNQILSTLEQVCQSGVIVTSKEVADKNLMCILSKALECNSNDDLLDTLSDALESVIKQSKTSNSNAIDALHIASIKLAAKVDVKRPNKVLLLQNIIRGNVKNQGEVVDKLMIILKDCEGTMPIAFHHMAQQNPKFVEKVLKNVAIMLGGVVNGKKEKEVMEILCGAIVKAINETKESEIQLALHNSKNSNLHSLIKSCQVAYNLDIDIPHSVKLHLILSTLQQICQSNLALSSEEIRDEKLMQLLNKALESDSKDHLLETLSNGLEEVIKQDEAGKLSSIDALHKASIRLGVNISHKKPNKALLLKNIIKGNVEDESEIRDKLVAILNDYENTISIAFQQMSQQNPKFVDEILENAAIMLEKLADKRDEEAAMEILYKAIVKTVNETRDSVIELALLGQQTMHGYESDDLQLLVKSCKIASNLDVDASHSVKLNLILSSLQQVHQSSVPLTNEEVGNEKLMRLLKIASEYDVNTNLLDTLGSALEDVIKGDIGGDKLKTIDDLHTLGIKLATKVHNKKPSKVLLLKNMIKNPFKVKKSGMVDRLISALNEYDTTVSNAFQQMSEQSPEFVNKVLENATVMLQVASNTTDEKEVMEILYHAILKTVSETSKSKIKQVLNNQQALHSDESNDLQILFKSCKVAGNLELEASQSIKLSHILSNLQQVSQSSVSLTKEEVGSENILSLLNLALECDTNTELLENVGNALEATIKQCFGDKVKAIDDLHALSVRLTTKVQDKKPNKALLLRNMIKDHQKEDNNQKMKRLITMLNDHETTVCIAFQHMCQQDSEFVDKVLENAAVMLKTIYDKEDEKEAMEILHRAIIKTVAETSESRVQEAIYNKKGEDFHLLITDAINLAKALGMCEVVTILNEVLKDRNSMQVLAKDTIVMEVLKRLTVMRQLAESRPNLVNALKDLHSDPYAARSDPRLRELVRESAMLMVIPEESLIKSSADIPSSIMFSDNCLAVEDFMVKTRQCGNTFLILKKGIQAVIPREAAKDVLTGMVPYTMLDENGIHYFKPLHVFNALKLPRVATNRFHNYTYVHPALLDSNSSSSTRGSSISVEDSHKRLSNGHGHHSPNHHEVKSRVGFSLK